MKVQRSVTPEKRSLRKKRYVEGMQLGLAMSSLSISKQVSATQKSSILSSKDKEESTVVELGASQSVSS